MSAPYAKGERVRILKGTGRTAAYDGFEGTIDAIVMLGVIVILDSDPAHDFRMSQVAGWEKASKGLVVRRFFNLHELEKIPKV